MEKVIKHGSISSSQYHLVFEIKLISLVSCSLLLDRLTEYACMYISEIPLDKLHTSNAESRALVFYCLEKQHDTDLCRPHSWKACWGKSLGKERRAQVEESPTLDGN